MSKDNKLNLCFAFCIGIALLMMIPVTLIGTKVISELIGTIIFTLLIVLYSANMIWMVILLKAK